jgi:hypothetical protein
MRKIFVFAVTLLLGASLSFAQTNAGDSGKGDASTKSKKHHGKKGGKKKKGSGDNASTPAPK